MLKVFSRRNQGVQSNRKNAGRSMMEPLEGRLMLSSTYYVSPLGNDKNPGTITKPFKTIAKINKLTMHAGDAVLFQGGQTFAGTITLNSSDGGTATAPVLIGSYGTGVATINGGSGSAISGTDTAGYTISNLNLVGSSTNTAAGISFYTSLSGNVKLQHLYIDHVTVSGFGKEGINLGSWNNLTGYNDVRVTYVTLHDNKGTGLFVWGQSRYAHANVYVGHATVYNEGGDGLLLAEVNGGVIERSVVHDVGTASNGRVGIWTYDSNNIAIQFNESYSNHTTGGNDGGGFDLDGGVTNSVMQYNYSHDNEGAGYGIYEYSGASAYSNNVVRYNVSQNDGRKNSYAGIQVWNGDATNGIVNTQIYNNTVYVSPAASGTPCALKITSATVNTGIRNNIFITTGGLPIISVVSGQTGMSLQNNDYFASGASFKMVWGGTTYTSLGAFQTATGQEKLNGSPVGFSVDPQLVSAGGGGTIGNADNLYTLTAYKLKSTSPLINQGLNLATLFGISTGSRDFFGSAIPLNGAYDLGAAEVG